MNEPSATTTVTNSKGEPQTLLVRRADWKKDWDRQALSHVRRTVFIEEQDVPEDLEWDEFDTRSLHFLAIVSSKQKDLDASTPVGTARLTPEGQIGRMAVLAEWRYQGIASALLTHTLAAAADHQPGPLFLDAQTHAISFYEAHGFVAEGPEFDDAGIPHRHMVQGIRPTRTGQG